MSSSPAKIEGTCDWTVSDIEANPKWRFRLSDRDIAEIERADASLQARGIDWHQMKREDFPLEGLVDKLALIQIELEDGCGMARLSNLPVEQFTGRLRHIWYGIGLHLGTPVTQDYRGMTMRDIEDKKEDTDALLDHRLTTRDGKPFKSSKARTLSNGALRFHTDRCDVVGLLCVHPAKSGGISKIASSVHIHNAMLERRPDLAALLYKPYHRSRQGEEFGGEKMTYPLPVFGQRDGRFTSHYSRTYVEAAEEIEPRNKLTALQIEALDLLAEMATEFSISFHFRPGDMQFLNNHVIYHARTAYQDDDGPRKRLLHRLWLSMPNSRALPKDHVVLWRNVEAGSFRGGIATTPNIN
ncbi:MAG: TauD/TfdA family dioxygenase [Pseudomonadota bacterium]|nr:TauD/TfdA family dioxygenase [Pseudomonadota bacterium]